MITAKTPFQFATASYITLIERQKANSISELYACSEQASDAAIFSHTFQSLGRYHFLREGFSNDFAQWVLESLNQPELAERLAGIDVRDYTSIPDLRNDLRKIISEFVERYPRQAEQVAFEPFYFLSYVEVTRPLPWDARTLPGFRAGLERLERIARERVTAIMCAEGFFARCHRSLIADALVVEVWRVRHIASRVTASSHRRTSFLRVRGGRLLYPATTPRASSPSRRGRRRAR